MWDARPLLDDYSHTNFVSCMERLHMTRRQRSYDGIFSLLLSTEGLAVGGLGVTTGTSSWKSHGTQDPGDQVRGNRT